MRIKRDTYKYHFKIGNLIVHPGISHVSRIYRREYEHRRNRGWEDGHIEIVGYAVTRRSALMWEEDERNNNRRGA